VTRNSNLSYLTAHSVSNDAGVLVCAGRHAISDAHVASFIAP
jgi:hypothetical protein